MYGADGQLLTQHDPAAVTLYLPGQQVVYDTATGGLTGTRYYQFPGGGTGIRVSNTAYRIELADRHNTPTLYVDSALTTPIWPQTDPYGNPRGAAVAAPDNHGFLDKPTDANTGLLRIGSRNYDAAVGRFITVDPKFERGSPAQLNGYSYGGLNPLTNADPTGEQYEPLSGGSGSQFGWAPLTSFTQVNGLTGYVDQNGVPHATSQTGDTPTASRGLGYLNGQLAKDGNLYNPKTQTGSEYFLQDEKLSTGYVPKSVVNDVNGGQTVAGTTADYVKVTYINGKLVSVDSVDATTTEPGATFNPVSVASTVNNKMSFTAKKQAQSVVYFARDDDEAQLAADELANNPNARIINMDTGFDTGEITSPTAANAYAAVAQAEAEAAALAQAEAEALALAQAEAYAEAEAEEMAMIEVTDFE